ncbi:ABC transporter substrate-binding protein [Pseudodonghicola flavimaris]|uniref:ABC transporter substrate-binding protein n=1 Tax=Pseudodonghicola flavimaris TaxID=3050036 RepID=A0ABT7EWW2_9RHOB|nr:ABC transporter substrate-binding protein [Pseudodonghicola flavimaris]MDK3016838.1 ABC transporter substrate-binding protein [Pseudodonghicola flavimaris]
MKLTRRLTLAAGLAVATLGMAPAFAQAKEVTKISFMEVIHSLFYSPLYVALDRGYFEEEGIAFDLVAGQGSDKVTAALLGGSVDIALAGPETTIYVETGKSPEKIRIFAGLTATDGSFLVGRAPAQAPFDWASLKGKKILGWREGSSPALFLREALGKAGLDPDKDVEIITNVAIPARVGAFMSGVADYGTFFEPDVTKLEAGGLYAQTNVGQAVGDIDYTVFIARQSYIAEYPEIVGGFARAIAKAEVWIDTAPAAEVAASLSGYFPGVSAEELAQTVERHREAGVWKTTPAVTPEAVAALQALLVGNGLMPAGSEVPYERVVDPQFFEAAE